MLKRPQYRKEGKNDFYTDATSGVGQTLHKALAWWLGVSSQNLVKKLKGAALHSSVLTSVFSSSHLKMQLHGVWTGSYWYRGIIPLHTIKHLPEEWQGISSDSPAATPLLTTTPPQTETGVLMLLTPTARIVQDCCFTLVQWRTWYGLNKQTTCLSSSSTLCWMLLKGTISRFNMTGNM